MKGLMLHCGANKKTLDDVRQVVTPEPEFRGEKKQQKYHPIPHTNLYDQVLAALDEGGYEIDTEAHALSHAGDRYFGLLEVKRKPVISSGPIKSPTHALLEPGAAVSRRDVLQGAHLDSPDITPDYGLVIGLRNAHDGRFKASIALGARVFVCDNLSFSGEVQLDRSHTKYIERDLPGLVAKAIGRLSQARVDQDTRFAAYKRRMIPHMEAHSLILRAMIAGVIPNAQVKHVLGEWDNPSHEEFAERLNVWRLFNAFTENLKPRNRTNDDGEVIRGRTRLMDLGSRTDKLHGLLDLHCGLELTANTN